MKISEVIGTLEDFRARHGEITVSRYNTCCCYGDWEEDIDRIEVEQNEGYPPYIVLY